MKKRIIFAVLLLTVLIISQIKFKSETQTPVNPDIENAYNEIYNSESYAFESDYGINAIGSKVFKISKNIMNVYNPNLVEIDEIELPFDLKDIVKYITSTNENIIYIATVDYSNYTAVYNESSLTPKSIYSIDFSTSEVIKLSNDECIIFDIMSSVEDERKLYIKYAFDDHLYYGYLDLFTGKFQSVVELNEDNYYDVYDNSTLLATVETTDDQRIEVNSVLGTSIYMNRIVSKHPERSFALTPFKYIVHDGKIYFLDETRGSYGTLRCFDTLSNQFSAITYELTAPLYKIGHRSDIDEIRTLLYDDSSLSPYVEHIYSFNESLMSEHSTEIAEKSAFSRLQIVSSENHKVGIIYQSSEKSIEIIYINSNTNTEQILETVPLPQYRVNKIAQEIKDKKGNMILTYIYKHPDAEKKPVVIFIHGGPFTRYTKNQIDPQASLIYKLGYNIIELNYFGSDGLGIYYRELADQNLPEAALGNVEALIDWIDQTPEMDGDNISVFGNSFGGYLSMLTKLRFPDRIKCAIAIAPGSINDIKTGNLYEYKETLENSDDYDVIHLLKQNPQEIGIVYNYLDPQLAVKTDWKTVAKTNPSLKILDQFDQGHFVPPDSFKKAVYYLIDQTK
ncbi:S9 family peptidase [Fusibacter sp. 3D3]|uniref:alpha/beta hydrolase family protein n=1 Tax=Fusibacter sp. 3D3 TaxID=1048380 RepID=UPI000853ACE4|nr:prolyl oligopeptidase family serine peptidase [Fusibacter sp. 3D3]GAU78176.1 dipeptidyl peptidase IV [Fusibacter sp. 3D3]